MEHTRSVIFLLLIIITTAFTHCAKKAGQAGPALHLTALSSMERQLPGLALKGSAVAEIKAAKNEYEAFQVVITAGKTGHLKNVRVAMSDLQGKNGSIGKENITMYREGMVYLRHSSPRAAFPPGLYPDPLIPFINPVTGDSLRPYHKVKTETGTVYEGAKYSAYPINLFPGKSCSIWVDVFVPAGTAPGIYKGTFTAGSRGVTSSVPVELTVWDFTLPDVASHRTHMGHFPGIASAWQIDRDSRKFEEIEMRFCKELAKCRVNPPIPRSLLPVVNGDGSITIIPERHEKLKKYIEEVHLADFEVPRAPFMTSTSNSPRPTPPDQTDPVAIEKTKRYYREYYKYLKDNGWEKRAYLYLLDEPNSVKDYKQVINLARVAESGAPELQRLVVEQTYKHDPSWPDLDDYIDIWCTLFGYIDRKTIQEKIDAGDEVWSYTALVQPAPEYHPEYKKLKGKNPPYWHIDRPLMSYRVPTWINRQYDIKGLLYWTTVGWYDPAGPWLVPTMAYYPAMAYHNTDPGVNQTRYYNGGGLLFYPGRDAGFDGPVTSIRLKNLREGLEDYEYFAILDRNGQGEFVRQMIDEVSPEWWDVRMDPAVLSKVRERFAEKIETVLKLR